MAKRARQQWGPGDVFTVELAAAQYAVGQVIASEPEALNSVMCAFTDLVVSSPADVASLPRLVQEHVIACILVTRDLLDRATWKVGVNLPIEYDAEIQRFEPLRASGWVGAKIYGSTIATDFLRSFHCLQPWDCYLDPEYFDKLLISPEKRPSRLVFKANAP